MSDETTTPTPDATTPAPAEPDAAAVSVAELVAEDTPPLALPPAEDPSQAEDPSPADEPVLAAPLALLAADPPAAEEVEPEDEPEAEPDDEPEVVEPVAAVAPIAAGEPTESAAVDAPPPAEAAPESLKKWYVVKVQSNREDTIKAAVERQIKIQNLEEFYGQIAIPVEEFFEKKKVSVKDKKTGQKVTEERNVTKRRKKYPGYLFAEVEFNDRILYVFRETSGVGDFVGATHHRAPNPMPDREVQQMLTGVIDPKDKNANRKVKVKLDFEKGDKVRIRDGAFAGSEAEVKSISEPKDPTDAPQVKVVVTIWGRPVEIDLEAFQVDKV